ncbi:hypothetical protein [Actinomadura opuntiae]|uniref:hypothetical protein n=1 Tax=Actinomadura sp. OS1-43 TaxID=604315 RepID=UPI00255AB99E|nr:hypothetical protein [Actinomadura sp. OS1-43]MDL4812933.1 hypothetical protein [Actinomadura sp. OS1-43]
MPRPRRLFAVVAAAGLTGLAIGFWGPGPEGAAAFLASARVSRRAPGRPPASARG